MNKEKLSSYIEKGFYTGVAATVGLVVVAAAPEICTAIVVGTVVVKAVDRLSDYWKNK